jgi:hypothetical protein
MGNCMYNASNLTKTVEKHKKFNKLKIYSLNVHLSNSFNVNSKINNIKNFIEETEFDILCIQGLYESKLLKTLVKNILSLNKNSINMKKRISIFPFIDVISLKNINNPGVLLSEGEIDETCSSMDVIKMSMSVSNDDNIYDIDCLIITKHDIISGTKVCMDYENKKIKKYVYIANIDCDGTLISIYNCTLANDYIGISNRYLRNVQINKIDNVISQNSHVILNDDVYDTYYVKNIHIITCSSNIPEMIGRGINEEYIHLIKTLKCIDVYRYIRALKDKNTNIDIDLTSAGTNRNNYILVHVPNIKSFVNIKYIGEMLYKLNVIVINSLSISSEYKFEDNPLCVDLLINRNSNRFKMTKNGSKKSKSAIEMVEKIE